MSAEQKQLVFMRIAEQNTSTFNMIVLGKFRYILAVMIAKGGRICHQMTERIELEDEA